MVVNACRTAANLSREPLGSALHYAVPSATVVAGSRVPVFGPTEWWTHIAPECRRRNGRLNTEARLLCLLAAARDLSRIHGGVPMKHFSPNANGRSPHCRMRRIVSGCVTERDARARTGIRAHHTYRVAQKGAQPPEP